MPAVIFQHAFLPASPAARGFGPRTPGEAVPGRAPGTYTSPLGERLASFFMPWRNRFAPSPVRAAQLAAGWALLLSRSWCLPAAFLLAAWRNCCVRFCD